MSATRAPRRAASQAAAAPITPAPIMAISHSRITSQEFNTATLGRYAAAESDQKATTAHCVVALHKARGLTIFLSASWLAVGFALRVGGGLLFAARLSRHARRAAHRL